MIAVLIQNAALVALLTPLWWFAARLIRRPALLHGLWVILLVKFLLPPILIISVQLRGPAWLTNISETMVIQVSMGVIWIGGSAFTLLTFLKRAEVFRQLIVSKGDVHSPACDLAEQTDPGGLLKTPEVLLVEAVHSPMLCGLGPHSWILFPKDLWYSLNVAERRSLLAHELAHFRRGDSAIRFVELLVTAIFWWHPALWLIKYEIEQAEEDCCDAIAAEESSKDYAKALLVTLDFLSEPEQFRPMISTLLMGRKTTAESRIRRILNRSVVPTTTKSQRLVLCAVGGVLLIFSPQFLIVPL